MNTDKKKKFTKFPNDILDRLLSYGLNNTQLLIVLYVIRKTYGWNKPYGDKIAIKKMAKDINKSRVFTKKAVQDLEKMGILERYFDGKETRTGIKMMRISNPDNWDKTLDEM